MAAAVTAAAAAGSRQQQQAADRRQQAAAAAAQQKQEAAASSSKRQPKDRALETSCTHPQATERTEARYDMDAFPVTRQPSLLSPFTDASIQEGCV